MRLRALRSFVARTPLKIHSIAKDTIFEVDDGSADDFLRAGYAVECTPENESILEECTVPENESILEECTEPETASEPEPEQETSKSNKKKRKVKPDEAESGTSE